MAALFISDLHIDASRPAITEQFLSFLATEARRAEALYILGDLFESWVGDDAADAAQTAAIAGLHALTSHGVPCFVMHGNRDFLLGAQFSRMSGAELLPDPLIVTLYGEPVLVMHGDALCTDDRAYQRLRATVREPDWQRQFLALSIASRRALAGAARVGSICEGVRHPVSDVVGFLDGVPPFTEPVQYFDLYDNRVQRLLGGDRVALCEQGRGCCEGSEELPHHVEQRVRGRLRHVIGSYPGPAPWAQRQPPSQPTGFCAGLDKIVGIALTSLFKRLHGIEESARQLGQLEELVQMLDRPFQFGNVGFSGRSKFQRFEAGANNTTTPLVIDIDLEPVRPATAVRAWDSADSHRSAPTLDLGERDADGMAAVLGLLRHPAVSEVIELIGSPDTDSGRVTHGCPARFACPRVVRRRRSSSQGIRALPLLATTGSRNDAGSLGRIVWRSTITSPRSASPTACRM